MYNNPIYPYYNNIQNLTGYRINPIGKIEEADSIYPDLNGTPLFFFDQSRNEIYVKQRKVQTGEVEILRYSLSKEPVEEMKVASFDDKINALRDELTEIKEVLKVKKVAKNDE